MNYGVNCCQSRADDAVFEFIAGDHSEMEKLEEEYRAEANSERTDSPNIC